MGNRVRLTNDTLNSYGYRVLTDGVDVSQYERNPILLYMHNRGQAIGLIKDIKKEDGEITGEPVFDEATDLSIQCRKQWDFGSLRMVSIGFEVIETSEAPEHLVPGQRYATVTKARLIEVSLVDIGANNDAIRLHRNGQLITLGERGECPLPPLNHNIITQPQMELKTLALQLGLPETADEATINSKLAELKASQNDVEKMRQENDALKLAQITGAVDSAIAAGKIPADKKQHFLNLGKKIGIETLNETIAVMAPAARLSAILQPEAPAKSDAPGKGPWETRMDEIRTRLNRH